MEEQKLEVRILKLAGKIFLPADIARLVEILENFGNIRVDKDYNTDKPILICEFEKYDGPVENIKKVLQQTVNFRFYGRED